jgi:hypothetical protein
MKRILFSICVAVIFVVDMVTGRAVLNGLDSLIPRKVTPHPNARTVEIQLGDGRSVERSIWCEDYYDAQGGSRGNFWAVRERGMGGMHDASREKILVKGVGTVSFIMPTCTELSGSEGFSVNQMVLLVNGAVYGHKSSKGDAHIFIARNAHEGPDVEIDFSLLLDGRKVR